MNKLKVVYCASGEIAVPTLESLRNHSHVELVKVITSPNRPAGRGKKETPPPVAKFANKWNLPLLQTENINHQDQVSELIKIKSVDLVLVFAFSHFFREKLLKAPRLGCFNIHPSLLPCYRGASPLQYALLNGDKVTGISIQKLILKMDAGDIVLQKKMEIMPHENTGKLQERVAIFAAKMAGEFIDLASCGKLVYKKQDEGNVTYAPLLKKEDGLLNFFSDTAQEIHNRVRAFHPWPSTYCSMNGKRVKVLETKIIDHNLSPGQIKDLEGLVVGCKKGGLRLMKIQWEGKKPCSDLEFLNGLKEKLQLS